MNHSNTLHAVRIDTHRVTLIPEACADEGGVPHEPALAKHLADNPPKGFILALLARAVLCVSLAAALVIGCALFKQPKATPDLPRATAKVTT